MLALRGEFAELMKGPGDYKTLENRNKFDELLASESMRLFKFIRTWAVVQHVSRFLRIGFIYGAQGKLWASFYDIGRQYLPDTGF